MAAPNPLTDLTNSVLDVAQKLAAVGNQPASLLAPALQQQLTEQADALDELKAQGAANTAALQQQADALDELKAQGAANAATLQQVQQQLAVVETRHRNNFPRQLNAQRYEHGDRLHPLVREQPGAGQGTLPPAESGFPETREGVLRLSSAALNNLADFYGQDFGHPGQTPLKDRRQLFSMFIAQG